MDGGPRQQAEAQRKKSEVKLGADRRRKEKVVRRLQSELTTDSDRDDLLHLAIGATPAPNLGSQGSLHFSSTSETTSPGVDTPDIWQLHRDPNYDIGLVVAFMDHIFPILFPFYQPSVLEGGRMWLLAVIMRDKAFRLHTNALTSYLMSVIPCRSESITNLCDLSNLIVSGIHDNMSETATLLTNMVNVLDLERALADGDEWQIHLDAALNLVRDLLQNETGLQGSNWPLILSRLSDHSKPAGFDMWSAEQAAFRFSVAKLVVFDIVTSSSLGRAPGLLTHHQELLHGDRDVADRNPLQLSDVSGCRNWVMFGLLLLLNNLAASVLAIPVPEDGNYWGDLEKQGWDHHVPVALPEKATAEQIKFQPVLDFDKDGCYNAPAIDAEGNVNHDWGGSRHDWESVIVFVPVNSSDVKQVAVSEEFNYMVRVGDLTPFENKTHPKVVYHKNGGSIHSFRFAQPYDDSQGVENDKGVWYRGPLVDYNTGFPSVEVRDKLMKADFWHKHNVVPIRPWTFETYLAKAIDRAHGEKMGNFQKEFNRDFFFPKEPNKEFCNVLKLPLTFPIEYYERPCSNNDPGFWEWIKRFFEGTEPKGLFKEKPSKDGE
ncbi:hypothetical protein E8E14_003406 [Neopestalotiopsis sp. 37M]|nr:hypothetical protein E8E14_003406 [Neopestalotiopsis sp. 37M]